MFSIIAGNLFAMVLAGLAVFSSYRVKSLTSNSREGRRDHMDNQWSPWPVVVGVLLGVAVLTVSWVFNPFPLNLKFSSFDSLVLTWLIIPMGAIALTLDSLEGGDKLRAVWLFLTGLLAIFSLVMLIAVWSGSAAVHSKTYYSLLGVPKNEGARLPRLNLEEAPLVSSEMAMQEAQKLLSQDPGLGSQVHIPNLYKQLVNGKLVWVGFLEPSSFSRWVSNGYTPGYVVVSATNPSDSKLVTGLKLKYLKDAWFQYSIYFHAQLAMPTSKLEDFSEEIDDKGNPYFVVTRMKLAVGMSEFTPEGTVLISPITGEVKTYSLEDTPKWVDRVQPAHTVYNQVSYWGQYAKGYWNSVFSGNGVLRPSSPPELIYGEDNKAYWYVGLTSSGRDNGIVGYLLVDSRTKKAYRYQLAGANESVAMDAVEGLVRANRYTATNPMIFEVEGSPTYVMTLTDSTGITRGYGLVNVHNYQIAVQASTLQDAVQAYANAMQTGSGAFNQEVKSVKVSGAILRKQADVQAGSTTYYMVVAGAKPILTVTTAISQQVPVLEKGDKVTVTFAQGSGQTAVVQAITLDSPMQ